MARLKTGTPPRLIASSINFKNLEIDVGDDDPDFFSVDTKRAYNSQIPCHTTWTNKKHIKLLESA